MEQKEDNCQSLVTRILDLEEIEEDIFRGHNILKPLNKRIFGGQVLGQALHAASKTVPEPFAVHSLHAYFLRPGDPTKPILYLVGRTRDGNSFTNRSVRAIQNGEAMFHMSASFQKPEVGFTHQAAVKPNAIDPSALLNHKQRQLKLVEDPRVPLKLKEYIRNAADMPIPVDVRLVDPVDILNPQKREPKQMLWMKAMGKLSDDPRVHQIVAAYCSDYSLVGTLLLPHGVSIYDPKLISASLDHCMYFHQPFRTDEWLLYELNTTVTSSGRGLAFGKFYDSKGNLVCSTVQEGLIRLRVPKLLADKERNEKDDTETVKEDSSRAKL